MMVGGAIGIVDVICMYNRSSVRLLLTCVERLGTYSVRLLDPSTEEIAEILRRQTSLPTVIPMDGQLAIVSHGYGGNTR